MPGCSDGHKHAPGTALFSGTLSLSLQPTEQHVVRSGYCAMRAKVPMDLHLHGFEGLAMRIKTDGRTYRVNFQTDGWNPHDLYMGFIKAPANQWVEAELAFKHCMLTSRGYVQVKEETAAKLNPAKLKTVCFNWLYFHGGESFHIKICVSLCILKIGIAIADGIEGDFSFEIEWIKCIATIDDPERKVQRSPPMHVHLSE
jgi:NADH dehydrogenase [ubiquinone] 1 alpha subcomplex assembly factor 1